MVKTFKFLEVYINEDPHLVSQLPQNHKEGLAETILPEEAEDIWLRTGRLSNV